METPMKDSFLELVFGAQPVQDGTGGVDLLAMNPIWVTLIEKHVPGGLWRMWIGKKVSQTGIRTDVICITKWCWQLTRQASKTHLQRELLVAPEKKNMEDVHASHIATSWFIVLENFDLVCSDWLQWDFHLFRGQKYIPIVWNSLTLASPMFPEIAPRSGSFLFISFSTSLHLLRKFMFFFHMIG